MSINLSQITPQFYERLKQNILEFLRAHVAHQRFATQRHKFSVISAHWFYMYELMTAMNESTDNLKAMLVDQMKSFSESLNMPSHLTEHFIRRQMYLDRGHSGQFDNFYEVSRYYDPDIRRYVREDGSDDISQLSDMLGSMEYDRPARPRYAEFFAEIGRINAEFVADAGLKYAHTDFGKITGLQFIIDGFDMFAVDISRISDPMEFASLYIVGYLPSVGDSRMVLAFANRPIRDMFNNEIKHIKLDNGELIPAFSISILVNSDPDPKTRLIAHFIDNTYTLKYGEIIMFNSHDPIKITHYANNKTPYTLIQL